MPGLIIGHFETQVDQPNIFCFEKIDSEDF